MGWEGGIDYDYKNLFPTPEPIPNYATVYYFIHNVYYIIL